MESDGLCGDLQAAVGAGGRLSWQGAGPQPIPASGVLFLLAFPDVI